MSRSRSEAGIDEGGTHMRNEQEPMSPKSLTTHIDRKPDNEGRNSPASKGFVLQTGFSGENTAQQRPQHQLTGSREVTNMSMKDRYSTFAPVPDLKEAKLQREFTFTGYDIMADVSPPETPLYSKRALEKKTLRDAYLNACKQFGISPVSYITRNLLEPIIRVRSHGLDPTQARALSIALVNNDKVEELDVADNCFGIDGAICIGNMVEGNGHIRKLNVSENRIGNNGLCAICKAVANSDKLRTLHLSAVGIKDPDLYHVKTMLDNDMSLRELYLTHNSISDQGCTILGKSLVDNDTLEVLDISWNHIRGKGALAIAAGLRENRGLRSINLSWNGFAMEGSEGIGAVLGKNKTLTELDLCSNRIHAEAMSHIMKGMKKNNTLSSLKLANNPLTPQACVVMLQAIQRMDANSLKELDIWDIVVTDEFIELLTAMQIIRPDFLCRHGVIITYSKDGDSGADDPDGLHKMDPRQLLVKLMEKDGLRIVDLFRRLDEDESWTVTRDEFKIGILKGGLSITEGQLDELVHLLDKDSDGVVDLREMIHGQRDYKRQELQRERRRKAAQAIAGKKHPDPTNPAVGLNADLLLKEMEALAIAMIENAEKVQMSQPNKMEETTGEGTV